MKNPNRGVKGRHVRLGGYPRELRVTAMRCVAGVYSYRLRDDERGIPIVYHYLVEVNRIDPPVIAKRTPWVPASAVKFVRHNYEVKTNG